MVCIGILLNFFSLHLHIKKEWRRTEKSENPHRCSVFNGQSKPKNPLFNLWIWDWYPLFSIVDSKINVTYSRVFFPRYSPAVFCIRQRTLLVYIIHIHNRKPLFPRLFARLFFKLSPVCFIFVCSFEFSRVFFRMFLRQGFFLVFQE